MTQLTPLPLVFGVMAVLALVESLIPLFPRSLMHRQHLAANLGLTALTLAVNLMLNTVLVMGALWMGKHGMGLIPWLEISTIGAIAVTIIALDMATYAAHVLMHKLPILWRFHLVHHSDPAVDVTTSLRQHPIETLVRFIFLAITAWGLGAPLAAIVLYRTVSVINAVLEHANIRVPQRLDMAISLLWVTPNMHKMHHSRVKTETDTNYGNLFSGFDRLFRTFTPSARAGTVCYGIVGYDDPEAQKFLGLLKLPFAQRRGAEQRAEYELTA